MPAWVPIACLIAVATSIGVCSHRADRSLVNSASASAAVRLARDRY